jgi:hypothetical protein
MNSPKHSAEKTNNVIGRITPSPRRLRAVEKPVGRQIEIDLPQDISDSAPSSEPMRESAIDNRTDDDVEWFRLTSSEREMVLLMRSMKS